MPSAAPPCACHAWQCPGVLFMLLDTNMQSLKRRNVNMLTASVGHLVILGQAAKIASEGCPPDNTCAVRPPKSSCWLDCCSWRISASHKRAHFAVIVGSPNFMTVPYSAACAQSISREFSFTTVWARSKLVELVPNCMDVTSLELSRSRQAFRPHATRSTQRVAGIDTAIPLPSEPVRSGTALSSLSAASSNARRHDRVSGSYHLGTLPTHPESNTITIMLVGAHYKTLYTMCKGPTPQNGVVEGTLALHLSQPHACIPGRSSIVAGRIDTIPRIFHVLSVSLQLAWTMSFSS